MGVIADIIYNSFHYVYCDSCRYQGNIDDGCDGCHRKSMEWAISINTAKGLEKKILKTIANEITNENTQEET